jgi:hypothetical protein
MDITIKNVPEGAEEAVKQMAMVAIERFLIKPLQPPQEAVSKFQKDMDNIFLNSGFEETVVYWSSAAVSKQINAI